ncbi:MAG TPA: alanine racemase [Stellaceae bacterium]|nr:alanine racemase [Stellaceae bacterium]
MACDPASRAGAILEIDLGAIVANWRLLAAQAAPAECAAVVKADAYGLGAVPVARALSHAGCRIFFVATLDEGIALRRVLGGGPEIAVLNGPFPGTAAEFAHHALIPVLNEPGQIAEWHRTPLPHRGRGRGPARQGWEGEGGASQMPSPAAVLRASAPSPAVRERGNDAAALAILHLDTGMSRLGLTAAEFARLVGDPPAIRWRAVMSHLACADSPEHPKNASQRARFSAAAKRLPSIALSLAASSGIFLGAPYHFDLVRPGAALYGVNPQPGHANPLRQVVRLSAKIVQVRQIDRGESVGYGAAHVMQAPGRLATVAVGYADGWLRSLGHRGCAHIAGTRVPLVGRVSMDLVTFDVSAVDPAVARPGAFVELLGASYGIDDAAADAGTIGYEILTALGARYHRTYRAAG